MAALACVEQGYRQPVFSWGGIGTVRAPMSGFPGAPTGGGWEGEIWRQMHRGAGNGNGSKSAAKGLVW